MTVGCIAATYHHIQGGYNQMIQFECCVLDGTARVDIIGGEPIELPVPERPPGAPSAPLGIVGTPRRKIDCKDKVRCGITDPNTGVTDWDRCPAHIEYEKRGTLEHLPGSSSVD